jgi:two-component system, OmpR family, sensor kinase
MKIKRLFWKIFGAFWLASLSIMFATSYVILSTVETEKYRNFYEKTLREMTERAINRYEGKERNTPLEQHLLRRFTDGPRAAISPRNTVSQRQIVRIYRGEEVIFQRKEGRKGATFRFDFTSDKGQNYTVEALEPRPPRMLMDAVKRLNTLQFFIILVASTLVSLLLSWSITRPLKKLGTASRQFAQGDLHTTIDDRLLRRADELGDLAQDMTFMMRRTQQTLEAQKQLLHHVSHELRAPLSRLQVSAELIQQRDEKSQAYIERIHRECERMDQLIQRILNFARLDETLSFTALDLVQLTQSHIETLQFEYPDRKIEFAHAMPRMDIQGDQNLLGEALDNVLRNACKYTPESALIQVGIEQQDTQIILEIRDHGAGVPVEELAKLTTPFYRSGERMHGDGFGLGLSIAKRAVEKLGGKLELENHPDGGLWVKFWLQADNKKSS